MKKFISMVMAAAMVVSLVPATAFAANVGEFKVVGAQEVSSTKAADWTTAIDKTPEIQIKVKDVDASATATDSYEVTLKLSGAEVISKATATKLNLPWEYVAEGKVMNDAYIIEDEADAAMKDDAKKVVVEFAETVEAGDKVIKLTITEQDPAVQLADGDIIVVAMPANTLALTKSKVGHQATVKVTGDFGTSEEMPFVTVVDKGIKVELDDEMVDVAEDEVYTIENIVVKPVVGTTIGENVTWGKDGKAELTLELSKGFEFANTAKVSVLVDDDVKTPGKQVIDGDTITFTMTKDGYFGKAGELVFFGLEVEAVSAKAGDICTLTVDMDNVDEKKVEVAKVIDYKVIMELNDADEDVPVFYSGVNVDNDGLNDDADHVSLEVDLYETFAGAWDMDKAFTLSLPEGVYVTKVISAEGKLTARDSEVTLADAFEDAYVEGGHVDFEFVKRVFIETDPDFGPRDYKNDVTFALELVADPGFVGDVTLKLEGAAVDTQEVVIAKFVAPMTVKAEQNDVIIDYRYTEVPTDIVVTEAEAGLWDKGLTIGFTFEDEDVIAFEDVATVTVDEASEMEVKATKAKNNMEFKVTEESDDEAAVVTIDGIELFMQRNIPAGPYALDMYYAAGNGATYDAIPLLGQDECTHSDCDAPKGEAYGKTVEDVCDYETTVHEAWINVVTAGRDQSDSSFTTTVVVPVGESYLVAGDKQFTLDVPAYINANGYIMVPVRAVANALGIANDCVQWNQEAKTVIIMYGDRFITMAAGSSTIYVGGTPLPAASSVEVVDGRAFLGLRDLANALGVKTIAWDPATKVGTLNPKA